MTYEGHCEVTRLVVAASIPDAQRARGPLGRAVRDRRGGVVALRPVAYEMEASGVATREALITIEAAGIELADDSRQTHTIGT